EFLGFRVISDGVPRSETAGDSEAFVTRGYIERFEADRLDYHAPLALHLAISDTGTLQRQTGRVRFGRAVHHTDPPFSFFTQFHAINSYALSKQQLARARPSTTQAALEWAATTMPRFPARTLHMSVGFPPGFQIDGMPELEIVDAEDRRLPLLERRCR